MTLHESKHGGFGDLGRFHQHFLGDQSRSPSLPPQPPVPRRPQRALYEHADPGPLRIDDPSAEPDCFDQLARLAQPENWAGPAAARHDDTWTLREYVEQTFERHHRRQAVPTSPDGTRTVFNTGLATVRQETIYGLFTRNPDPQGPPWRFDTWLPESDRGLTDHFAEPPGFAEYTDHPADLVYDRRHELVVVPARLLESDGNLAALPDPLRSNPYQAGLVLEGAVRRAETRVHRDHRAAVPCWDPDLERVQLLLPLSLTRPETVDVALLVAREGETYRGRMLLGLDLAHARARVISRAEEWLDA
ncbi:DUF3825 domain-containing protein [Actinomadura craniellae]|uniref:DUF3825 domain-containing protein n=1 Tax=Actinomadura craniellae TaxID=2231787 RepID=UPI001313EA9E|nr:DUF3825 domain-containing protein [Actinomadura craniellae]